MTASSTTAPPETQATPTPLTIAMLISLGVCLVGELLDALDGLITTIAGPTIVHSLGGNGSFIQWLTAGYTVAMAGGLMIGGRLGDLYGRKRIFLLGMAGFSAASAVAAFASAPGWLIAARVLQGLLGALMVPQTFGLYQDIFPKDRLSQMFGLIGPVMMVGGLAGPIAAGFLLGWSPWGLSWRLLFLINLPFTVVALLVGAKALPSSSRDHSLSLDWGGSILASLGVASLVYALVQGREAHWPWWSFALMAAFAAIMTGFTSYQKHRAAKGLTPLMEPSLLTNRAFTGGMLFGLVAFGAGMSIGFFTALYAQLGLGLTPLQSSLLTLPDMAGMLLAVVLMNRFGESKRALAWGALIMGGGALLLLGTLLTTPANALYLVPSLLVTGFGSGLTMGPYFDVIVSSVSEAETGSASGLLAASQQVSSALSISLLGGVFFHYAEANFTVGPVRTGFELTLGLIAVLTMASVYFLRWLPSGVVTPQEELAPA